MHRPRFSVAYVAVVTAVSVVGCAAFGYAVAGYLYDYITGGKP